MSPLLGKETNFRGGVEREPEAIRCLETKVDAGGLVLGDGDIQEGAVTEAHKVTIIITLTSNCYDQEEKKLHY